MSDFDESDIEDNEIDEAWHLGRSSLVPKKSKERYENTYKIFKDWCNKKGVKTDEKSLVAYFVIRNKKIKAPGSLWAEYSMLKSTIFLHESIDISKFSTLIGFIKKKNVGYRPKKANVFSKEDITKFLLEAPDNIFLVHKVGMIFGIAGACRREELYNLRIEDIEERDGILIVKLLQTKTHIQRSFVIINDQNEKVQYLDIYHKYLHLRPSNARSSHLFLNYRNGKCTNQVIGKGTIGRWPSKIAEFLSLTNPAGYTGHSFRRTSATLLVNRGEDILGLKRHGGWKSSNTAESYIGESLENKIKFAQKILYAGDKKREVLKASTTTSNQENKESSKPENCDIIDIDTTLSENHTHQLQEPNEFPIGNVLSSTSVYQNKFPLAIGSCYKCVFNINVNK